MGKLLPSNLRTSTARFLSTKTNIDTQKTLQEFKDLCKKGHIKQAFETQTPILWTDPHLFSLLLQSTIPQNSLPLVKQLHSLTLVSGYFKSDKFVTNHLLNAYSKMGELEVAASLFDVMPKRNVMSCNILINGYLRVGDFGNAYRVFDEMPERNVATWNAMVAGMTQFELNEEGLGLFREMHLFGFSPDEFAIGSVLRGCAGLRASIAGRQVHGYVVKFGFGPFLVVGSSLAHMYMKCGCLGEGEEVIKSMPDINVVAWNTLIGGNSQNGHAEGVLHLYSLMKTAGFRPNKITFVSVISSCSDLATLGQGQQIHAEVIKSGASAVGGVISSLISLYSRCGCLEDSVKALLDYKGYRDVVVWSSLLTAYGFHGRGEEAVKLFEQMESQGFEANDVTFLSLLYACSHCGLKEKAVEFLRSMEEKYGLKPKVQHYTCVVDLLGRSGRLDEAEAMIRSMPVEADTVIWKTLLSACKIHKRTDMARRIAEEILRLDPRDSSSYVLLSNVHAHEKRWEDVSVVRKAMRGMNVKKEPGISWFEVKNRVHQFSRGDKSHPRSDEIYLYLKELMDEIKKRGYVPDTALVLHDTDNEEKEYSLACHSEKLAIAFALITTPPGAPIRIMKNLRVCSDCHVAIKFISQLKNREIIVRDTTRFHNFKNGTCSCGDYW